MAKLVDEALAAALADMLGHSIREVRRIVIDIKTGEPPTIYIERFESGKLINVIKAFENVEVRFAEPDEQRRGE